MSAHYSEEFREILRIVGRGRKLQRDLTTEEATAAMHLMLDGGISDAQIGAFLVTMRVKEETVDEIIGFRDGARRLMQPLKINNNHLIDIALPYDGKAKSLQTGVAAAMMLAAAGHLVLLHGADNVPAKMGVGPLNLLRALGYPVDLPPEMVAHSIQTTGFGVLNIQHILPQWTALTPVRHHFGLRTLMNTVEKLLNPASASIHISGFYHSSYLNRMARALPGTMQNWIVQGEEGSIDIRPGKKTRVHRVEAEQMVETTLDAAEFGLSEHNALEMPNEPEAHAAVIQRALTGEPGPAFDQIALTAATLLWMVGAVPEVASGLTLARDLMASNQVMKIIENTLHPDSV